MLGGFGKFKIGFKSISKARNFASSVVLYVFIYKYMYIQGGSNMTGTDLYVNKPHCAATVRP